MDIFLSTSCIKDNFDKIFDLLDFIDGIEINSSGDGDFALHITNLVKSKKLKICSIHASAGPHKTSNAADYTPWIASLEDEKRLHDVEQLGLTALWAKSLGVDRIVVHGGKVESAELKEMFLDYKKRFIESGSMNENTVKIKKEIVRLRSELASKHIEKLIESMNYICKKFPDTGFYLETRVHYFEIPTPAETLLIFERLKLNNLGYWNDIGHSYIEDRLGLINFSEWKRAPLLKKCGGLHVHDIDRNLKDHYPPGMGSAPLKDMLNLFPMNIPWVLEINSRHTPDEIIGGIKRFKEIVKHLKVVKTL